MEMGVARVAQMSNDCGDGVLIVPVIIMEERTRSEGPAMGSLVRVQKMCISLLNTVTYYTFVSYTKRHANICA